MGKKVHILRKLESMLNKIYFILFLVFCISINDLYSQTNQWRLIWTKNAADDSVEYYVVYRNEDAVPSSSDSVGWQAHPPAVNTDSVVYLDMDVTPGIHYYYRVEAVDYLKRRSGLSESAHAAVPEIMFGTLTLPVDTSQSLDTVIINLNNSNYVNDPDDDFNVFWEISGGSEISAQINAQNRVTFIAPTILTLQEEFEFSVIDPDGFYDVRPVQINLTPTEPVANESPTINSSPQRSINVDEYYEYTISASDPDGDDLTFTMTEGPAFLSLTKLNNTSALISGTPTSTNAGHRYRITIVVSDGKGGTDEQSYRLSVESLPTSENLISLFSLTTYGSSIVHINWTTIEPTKDHVVYGLDASYGMATIEDADYVTEHETIIRDLLPETEYHFRIISERTNGEILSRPDSIFITEEGVNVEVFPIPFVASQAQGSEGITFVNVPEASTIVIYNLMAEPVFKVENITHVFNWDIKNQAGKDVSAGLYMYYVKDKKDKKLDSGKLIIVR
jgi:hypothetical protein